MDGSLTGYLVFAVVFSIAICFWAFFLLPKRPGFAERETVPGTSYRAGSGSAES